VATRSPSSTNLSRGLYPVIDRVHRVIATALFLQRRPPNNVNHWGRVRADFTRSYRCWKQTETDKGHEIIWRGGMSASQTPFAPMDFLSPQPPEGQESLGYQASCDRRSNDISDKVARRSGRGRRRHVRGGPFSLNSGTTGVAHEQRLSRPIATSAS
jgi:hypothetical protein